VVYDLPSGPVEAVKGIYFAVYPGEILGFVGESGCGKTTSAMAILGLLSHPGRVAGGRAIVNGVDLLSLSTTELRRARWRSVALIPQGAMNSLNPTMKIGRQLLEVFSSDALRRMSKAESDALVESRLDTVSLPPHVKGLYPHELSGGMKQRVCIAMASMLDPQVIIADEPTSALDVVVQRVVAQTLLEVCERTKVGVLLIGHDLGLMAQLANNVAVMKDGEIVELGATDQVLRRPTHPYSQHLISSIPQVGGHRSEQ